MEIFPSHLQIKCWLQRTYSFPGDFSLTTFVFVKELKGQFNTTSVSFLTNVILDNQWYRKVIPYNEIHITSISEENIKLLQNSNNKNGNHNIKKAKEPDLK